MTPTTTGKVIEAMTEAQQPQETVNFAITANEDATDFTLSVTNASSQVLDTITDNGYYMSAVYGSIVITEKEN